MIKKELRKEINVLKSKKEDGINLLEWRLRMEKILRNKSFGMEIKDEKNINER